MAMREKLTSAKSSTYDAYSVGLNALQSSKVLATLKLARSKNKKIIFILGTPNHRNLGDQAIAQAENALIDKNIKNAIVINLSTPMIMRSRQNLLLDLICEDDIILGHGGGNMGDTYMGEELCRRKFIQEFPNNKIVIFPQTFHFSDTPYGVKELKNTISIYSKHKDLTLIAREQLSYEKMVKVFSNNKVILTPDIVLTTDLHLPPLKREGVLMCLRNDEEGKLSTTDKRFLKDFSEKNFSKIKKTDTLSDVKFFPFRSKHRIVQNKFTEFRSSKLVVTDRLHGMVFSAITGTPCIALANFNHKVKETYTWIKYLPYIKFCTDLKEFNKLYTQLDLDETYAYNPDHYDKYWGKIRDAIASGR